MHCPNCRKEIIDDSNYCVYCREVVNPEFSPVERSRPLKVLTGFLVTFIITIAAFFIGGYLVLENYRKDTIVMAVFIAFILLSICPSLVLYLKGQKAYARGAFFGTLTFYILLATFFIIITTSY